MMLGAAYQPVTYGIDVAAVQGQVRIRAVNTFDGMTGQTYARLLGFRSVGCQQLLGDHQVLVVDSHLCGQLDSSRQPR